MTTSNESSQRTSPEPEGTIKIEEEEEKKEEVKPETNVINEEENGEGIDETIPDCTNWSCEEVYSYFLKYILPEEANVFRDQVNDVHFFFFFASHLPRIYLFIYLYVNLFFL